MDSTNGDTNCLNNQMQKLALIDVKSTSHEVMAKEVVERDVEEVVERYVEEVVERDVEEVVERDVEEVVERYVEEVVERDVEEVVERDVEELVEEVVARVAEEVADGVVYARDSMARFGDDMCGHILGYLSLINQIHYKQVCRQWNRCIDIFGNDILLYVKDSTFVYHNRYTKCSSGLLIRPVNANTNWDQCLANDLAKYPILKTIHQNIKYLHIEINCKVSEKVLDVIMKDSKQLISLDIEFGDTADDEIIDSVLSKYGPQLTALYLKPETAINVFQLHSHLFNRLKDLNSNFSVIFNQNNDILVTNLISFTTICRNDTEDLLLLQLFVKHYSNSLKTLVIILDSNDSMAFTRDVLEELAKLKQLRQLSLYCNGLAIDESFIDCLKLLATQSRYLKRFRLHIMVDVMKSLVKPIFESMAHFKRLQELHLSLCHQHIYYSPFDLSMKSLSDCKRLTRLYLDLPTGVLNEYFFDSIDTLFPKLESLVVSPEFVMTPTIRSAIKKLSKLKRLDLILKTTLL